jgi:hypothetical protein
LVIARRSSTASTATPLLQPPRPHVGDHRVGVLVELDPLDHGAIAHAEQATPYLDAQHPVLLLSSEAVRSPET